VRFAIPRQLLASLASPSGAASSAVRVHQSGVEQMAFTTETMAETKISRSFRPLSPHRIAHSRQVRRLSGQHFRQHSHAGFLADLVENVEQQQNTDLHIPL
jgi:hypothetical protein